MGSEWQLSFDPEETKTHQPILHVLPSAVVPYLELYLAEIRPCFPRNFSDEALWSGSKGHPLAYESLYSRVKLMSERLCGVALSPHSFRSIAATALADESPKDALFARPLLSHTSPTVTERYYIRASQRLAGNRVNDVLRMVRDEGGNR